MRVLRARLYEAERERQQARARGDARGRRSARGERAEKIRTYNFPENRVTDHRIKLTRAPARRRCSTATSTSSPRRSQAEEQRRALEAASA